MNRMNSNIKYFILNHHTKMLHKKHQFVNSFNYLQKDPSNTNICRRYGAFYINQKDIKYDNLSDYVISMGKQKHNVSKLSNPEDIFINSILLDIQTIMKTKFKQNTFKCEIHQIRKYVSNHSKLIIDNPHINKRYDYKISPLLIKKYNIKGGDVELYDRNNKLFFTQNLKNYEYLLYNNQKIYNNIKPLYYYLSDGFDDFGFQDELHINITKI